MRLKPQYDPDFRPAILEVRKFKEAVSRADEQAELLICVERNDGYNYHLNIDIFKDFTGHDDYNYEIIERLVKTILWVAGGFKIYVAGSDEIYRRLAQDYRKGGKREFDALFMQRVYGTPFEVVKVAKEDIPVLKVEEIKIPSNLTGCRIGFDAGGSDRKVSAVVDGEVIFSTETVWHPKLNSDPEYHYERIVQSFKLAASKMPKVDAVGISSAGIYINNEVRVASLFIQVPDDVFEKKVKDIYKRAVKDVFGDIPFRVVNDGEVTALAGANSLKDNEVLGIAMGTSEAVGYVNKNRCLTGWLNELAFAPVDFNKEAMVDEWSGDYGCGVKYFSQDSVIKLAEKAGIIFEEGLSSAEKLKVVQELNDNNDPRAQRIFEDIGIYLGYTLAYYSEFYSIQHVLLLGRVMSGKGGESIIEYARKTLDVEFLEYQHINLTTPDEYTRRVGQSIAAASLPNVE